MSSRHTVNLNRLAYDKLTKLGHFGETYSELIIRIVDIAEAYQGDEKL